MANLGFSRWLSSLRITLWMLTSIFLAREGLSSEFPSYLKVTPQPIFQSLGSSTHLIYDVHGRVFEEPAVGYPGLKVIRVNGIFKTGTVFFGFGLPNVYMAEVDLEGRVFKVDARSLHRKPMKIVDTNGKVQSGILLVPKGLHPDDIARVREIARENQGCSDITCVHTNCGILGAAGFTVKGVNIADYYLPNTLLTDILRYGLELNGKPVNFDIVKTTPTSLSKYVAAIKAAVNQTALRHVQRAFDTEAAKNARIAEAQRIKDLNLKLLQENAVLEHDAGGRLFDLELSQASDLGAILQRFWGAHILYRIRIPQDESFHIDNYLAAKLLAFPQEHPSWATWLKKHFLFAPVVVSSLHRHMASIFRPCGQISEHFLGEVLPVCSGNGLENRYNIVVTGKEIILAKLDVYNATIDWTLSKHVLIAGYSDDVRFAGELWKTGDGKIFINNNSGTYQPTREQLNGAVEMASHLFPSLEITAEANELP